MANILLTWELGGGLGHLVNLKPIAQQLSMRGHRVFAALQDVTRADQVFEGANVEYLQAPIRRRELPDAIKEPRNFSELMHNNCFNNIENMRSLGEAWRHIYHYTKPDLVIYDYSPMAMFAYHGLSARKAIIGTGFFSPPRTYPLPNLRSDINSSVDDLRYSEDLIVSRINQVFDSWNSPRIEHVADLFSALDEDFLATFPELDHYPQRKKGNYLGAWAGAIGTPPQWPNVEGKKIFAYVRKFPALPHLLQILRELKQPTLIYTNGVSKNLQQKYQSESLQFSDKPLDLTQVSKQCDLAILSANHGTTATMLLAGVPSLQIPSFLEQSLFALSIVRLGAGCVANTNDENQISAALKEMLNNEQYKISATLFAERYANFNADRQISLMIDRIVELLKLPSRDTPTTSIPTRSKETVVQCCAASDLLHPLRFDLAAKYLYAKHRGFGTSCTWAKSIYLEHIRVFNGFQEASPRKNSADDFVNSFNQVLDSIKKIGYAPDSPPVPVSKNGVILNGAHRVAACLLYKQQVNYFQTDHPSYNFSAAWFARWKRHVPTGMTIDVADPIALEYCRMQPNTILLVALPDAFDNDQPFTELIKKHSQIIYAKIISLTSAGLQNISQLITNKTSLAGDSQTEKIEGKEEAPEQQVRILLCQVNNLENVKDLQAEFPKKSVFVTLPGAKTVKAAEMLFNTNSIKFLNCAHSVNHSVLQEKLNVLVSTLAKQSINKEFVCIMGKAAASLYNNEDCQGTIDLLCFKDEHSSKIILNDIRLLGKSETQIDHEEALFNPKNYFYYSGMKFEFKPIG